MQDLIALTTKGFLDNYRYIIHEGGTRSGKTHSLLTTLYHIVNAKGGLASVVSETFPHLRKGAIRDYKRILESQKIWDEKKWNKTDSVHAIGENNTLEFFSADTSDKVHGPERDYLFLNEAQNIDYEIARHLFVRTKKTIFIDFNPTREFWAHTELRNDPKTLWIHSTYLDNPYLTPEQIAEIERNKNNKAWWSIYGEGIIAESESQIYTGWQLIDEIPHEARLERYGLDFGYTNDPTVIIAIYKYNGGIILDEVAYQTGMKNKMIADLLANLPKSLVIADSAEPKSIDEIAGYGISIIGATKGQGSVNRGIDYVQSQKISITKRSVKTIKAYRNYLWMRDKDDKIINEPDDSIHEWSNSMDALRYGIESFNVTGGKMVLPTEDIGDFY
jgi:phage terminase large subunit